MHRKNLSRTKRDAGTADPNERSTRLAVCANVLGGAPCRQTQWSREPGSGLAVRTARRHKLTAIQAVASTKPGMGMMRDGPTSSGSSSAFCVCVAWQPFRLYAKATKSNLVVCQRSRSKPLRLVGPKVRFRQCSRNRWEQKPLGRCGYQLQALEKAGVGRGERRFDVTCIAALQCDVHLLLAGGPDNDD